MKRLSLPLALCLSTLLSLSHSPKSAEAIPFLDIGPKLGYGVGLLTGVDENTDTSVSLVTGGLAASIDLVMLQLEVDLLYLRATTESSFEVLGVETTSSFKSSFFSVPIIGRLDISPIPMVKLAVGGGYERRFNLDDDNGDSELNYLPLSIRSDLSIPLVGAAGVEARFNYQMGDNDVKAHEFMIFIHAFL